MNSLRFGLKLLGSKRGGFSDETLFVTIWLDYDLLLDYLLYYLWRRLLRLFLCFAQNEFRRGLLLIS
jgi:hypothetical protein